MICQKCDNLEARLTTFQEWLRDQIALSEEESEREKILTEVQRKLFDLGEPVRVWI